MAKSTQNCTEMCQKHGDHQMGKVRFRTNPTPTSPACKLDHDPEQCSEGRCPARVSAPEGQPRYDSELMTPSRCPREIRHAAEVSCGVRDRSRRAADGSPGRVQWQRALNARRCRSTPRQRCRPHGHPEGRSQPRGLRPMRLDASAPPGAGGDTVTGRAAHLSLLMPGPPSLPPDGPRPEAWGWGWRPQRGTARAFRARRRVRATACGG